MALTEKQKADRKRQYYKHKDKEMDYHYIWTKANPFKDVIIRTRLRAKKRGAEFDLTEKYLKSIWTGICPIFETPLSFMKNERGKQNASLRGNERFNASLDRIDNTKGYIIGNVQWISYLANSMKREASQDELQAFARWILESK